MNKQVFYVESKQLKEGMSMLDISKSICRKLDALYASGKLDRIEVYLLTELIKNQPLCGNFNSAYVTVLYEMGVFLRKSKKYSRARDWFKLLSRIICARLGPDSFENAVVLENIAATYELAGEPGRALHCYLQTLKIYKSAIGPRHIRYVKLLKHICKLVRAQEERNASVLLGETLPGAGRKKREGVEEYCANTRSQKEKSNVLLFTRKH